ncbi:MAG TPA: nitroreductase family protein [Chloroflexota bacterium]|jgi:nitroreductase|nr:nitroreductase family protein [Chloroflexota bacterium]
MNAQERLSMPIGEAIFTQRAIRRLKPDPIPDEVLETILQAARRAPSGGNLQPWRFLVVRDPDLRRQLAECYVASWWHRRRAMGIAKPEDMPRDNSSGMAALYFTTDAEHFSRAPVHILVCNVSQADNVMTACQNLMLAARALGIGSTITRIGEPSDERVHELFGIPPEVDATLCIPMGYPLGKFGDAARKPMSELAFLDRWQQPGPWA